VSLTITAAICTRNRSGWVRKAVESLLRQDLPVERLTILVVDNGSTDDTPEVVREAADGHPHVRYELVTTPGLSIARNRAIELTTSDVIAFLDDDAVAVAAWARLHLEAFESDPQVLATGGRIHLVWPRGRPEWLPAQREGLYAGLDLGDVPHEMEPPAIPYGANMAFRRSAFDVVAPFAVTLGRQGKGKGLLSGEERDVCERIRDVGGRILYLPDAAVDHHVLPDRDEREWLLRRSFDQGRSNVVMNSHRGGPRPRTYWAARTAWQSGMALRHAGGAAFGALAGRPSVERTRAAAAAAQAAGTARESARMARRPAG
jgi:glycosyltransferase involved in cell wall biosynthesis